MQALVELIMVHKADADVAQYCAGALANICDNGFLILSDHDLVVLVLNCYCIILELIFFVGYESY